jgi:peptide/nickel transport system ATP-binding protein
MTEAAPLARLVVQDLTVAVAGSGAAVIEDVSVEVAAGEVLGVVGESGSGKTTLGLAMVGHARRGLKIAAGSVRLDGTDLLSLPPAELRRLRGAAMAYIPQDPSSAINPAVRVGSLLKEVLAAHGRTGSEAEARLGEVLAEVGLDSRPALLSAYPHQLSGGQQQRIAIAMAFACRPRLIVLDEPTTGLDVTTQRTVLETVARMCASYGVAAVYVSHDVVVVGELSHRVAVVYSGRVVETGATTDVFGVPAHPYTQGLLRAVPSPERSGRLVGMEGVPPRPGQRPRGCSFAPRCPLVVERCTVAMPELIPAARTGQLARCVLVETGQAQTGAVAAGAAGSLDPDLAEPGESAAAPVLQVTGLDAFYGHRQVLFGIDLTVPANTCVAIVGESGSGKTTLARCVAGLHTNWAGDIRYGGQPLPPGIRRRPKDVLRGIQYVFQNPYASLNPRRTVGGLIAQPLETFAARRRARASDNQILDALRSAALSVEVVNRYPDQLSGGERQRVAIARTLAVAPALLVCDEVTSSLDVSVQAAVVELLRRLQEQHGLAMIFITHNIALIRSIAQQVAVMHDGQITEIGTVADVLDHPRADYTRQLLDDVPKFSAAMTGASDA